MVQVIQHKRRIGAGAAGGPPTLAAGELAFNSNGVSLHVGVDAAGTVAQLVGIERQLEIHANSPAQTVAGGAKTVPLALLKVPGGNVGEALTLLNADGTLGYAPMVSASQQFVGSFLGSTGVVTFTTVSGGTGPGLPAPGAANNGWYVIASDAGATPPAGSGVTGPFNIGDWIISNGTAWTHLAFGGSASVVAADVGVAPAVMGGDDVQEVLTTMAGTFVSGPAASVADNIATYSDLTGKLIKDGGTKLADLATVAYVDTENAAQDLIITANAAFVAAQPGIDAAQDAAIAGKGDVTGPAVAVADNIAVYDLTTGKLIKDGGSSITAINAAIAAKADAAALANYLPLAGGTVTGAINLPAAMPVAATESAHKAYVDQEIAAVSAGASVSVVGPELTGTGLSSAPITFTGITAEALVFSGKGLSTDPLLLLLVDGGTY